MPTGPKGQKRPADMIGNAVRIPRIATGEEEDDFPADDGKDKAAQPRLPHAGIAGCGRPRKNVALSSKTQMSI